MTQKTRHWPEFLTGLGFAAAGLVIGWEAASIKVIAFHTKVGPAAFLWVAAILLVGCGLWVAWQAHTAPAEKIYVPGPVAILAGLVQTVFLFEPLGFIISSTLLFVLTAWGLGSRNHAVNVASGLALSVLAFALFRYGLDLRLPVGELFT